jgi:threonine/homoserine/homoserine lactone efflux protein
MDSAPVTSGALIGVAVIALTMVLTPGPNMIYLASRSVAQGRRAGLISLAGVAVGFLAYLLLATAGLTAILVTVPALFTAVKLAGAAYLLYLAWTMVRPGGRSAFDTVELPPHRPLRLFGMGLLTNLLNPKIAVMYMALIPQFVSADDGPVWLQSLILGSVQIAIAVTVNGLIVLGSARLSAVLHARPRWMRAQRLASGAVLASLAVKMAAQKA